MRLRACVRVFIAVPPYWIDEPRDVSVLLGQPLAVSCRADGYPKPNVTWSRNIGKCPLIIFCQVNNCNV